jgi:GAF domain-containing protein
MQVLARTAADLGPALVPAGHHELLRSITSAAKDLFNAAACSLALLDEAQENLVFEVASGAGAEDVVGMRVPVNRGIAGWVVTSGQPIAIADVRRDPRFASEVAESTGYVPRSIVAMPLQTEREMLGAIEVLDRAGGGRDDRRDMQLLGVFAEQASLAIENSRVFSRLGQALFEAASEATDGDLRAAFERIAQSTPGPNAELSSIARLFHDLGAAGEDELRLVTRICSQVLAYVRTSRRWS